MCCVCVCTCCSMLAVNCMAWWCCCSSMSMWRSSRKSFLSSSIQPSSSWEAAGRRDASLNANIQLQVCPKKATSTVESLTVGCWSDNTTHFERLHLLQSIWEYFKVWTGNTFIKKNRHNDPLITCISGLATSREIFWFPSLVSSATASSRFWISTPLILKKSRNY